MCNLLYYIWFSYYLKVFYISYLIIYFIVDSYIARRIIYFACEFFNTASRIVDIARICYTAGRIIYTECRNFFILFVEVFYIACTVEIISPRIFVFSIITRY